MTNRTRTRWGAILAASVLVLSLTAATATAASADDLVFTPAPGFPVTVQDVELSFDTALSPTSPITGDVMSEPTPVFQPRIRNLSTTQPATVGLSMDLSTAGTLEPLWQRSTWAGLTDDFETVADGFAVTLAPGEEWPTTTLPAWPGRTFGIYSLTPNGPPDPVTNVQSYVTGALLTQWTSDGRFVPVRFGVNDAWYGVGIGSGATVAGSSSTAPTDLFPGVTATVTAPDLTPGESLSMWLLPQFDYFYFYLAGAVLPTTAIATGNGTVGPDGAFSGTFVVPPTIALGDYQLVIGDTVGRYWPAGSYESFQITAPDAAAAAATPAGASQTSLNVGLTTLTLDFPATTVGGTTSAAVSTTGPTTTGPTQTPFTLASDPQLYYHLDTTAQPNAPVTVCVTYDVGNIPGSPPSLYHYALTPPSTYTWTDITTSRTPGKVCGVTSSFSPFTLGYPLHDGSTKPPAKADLSSDNGKDGLDDGDYIVTMDLKRGENARIVRLLETAGTSTTVVAEQEITRNTPNPQRATFTITGKRNGVYLYTAELINSTGTTTTKPLIVKVKDANPAKPTLTATTPKNGAFTLTAKLSRGTNATSAQFFENGRPIGAVITLTASTPNPQLAALTLTKPKSTYTYTVIFANAAGFTTSSPVTVKVK